MQMREIIHIFRKRLWIIVLGTMFVSAMVFLASRHMAPVYRARALLMVNQSTDAPFAGYLSLATGQDLAVTYSELLKTRPLLEIVITNLDLNLTPDDLTDRMIGTSLIAGTQLLELSVEDTNPQLASEIANEIAFTFVSLRNTERQLEDIMVIQQDVGTQLSRVKQGISSTESRLSGLVTEDQASLAQTTLASQQQAYAQLLGTYLDIRLTQSQLLDVTVVEPAVPPIKPIRPDIVLYTILGTSLGFVFSTGVAFLVDYLDGSLETSDDVKEVVPLPTLSTIPRARSEGAERNNGLVTLTLPGSPSSEAYRVLRTSLRYASIDAPPTTLLITSPEAGAGKTTVTANLGVVCAQAGLRVVLMDTDVRRPTLHQRFEVRNSRGLTDLLADSHQDVESFMLDTGVPDLRLISAGPVPPNPSELLGSRRMQSIVCEASRRADLVLLDAPPVLPVTDAAVMAAKVDGVILLVEAKRTSRDAAHRAWESLSNVGATVFGVVLTKARVHGSSYYGYYTNDGPPRRGSNPLGCFGSVFRQGSRSHTRRDP